MKNNEKTNVMRLLDGKKIPYTGHTYEPDPTKTGEEIAAILGKDADKVFKSPGIHTVLTVHLSHVLI